MFKPGETLVGLPYCPGLNLVFEYVRVTSVDHDGIHCKVVRSQETATKSYPHARAFLLSPSEVLTSRGITLLTNGKSPEYNCIFKPWNKTPLWCVV